MHVCYPRPPVGRGRTRSLRFALAVGLVAVTAGVVATTVHAFAFIQGDPCNDTQPLFICPGGTVGVPYSIKLKVEGGNGEPYTYYLKTGSLPSGLTLDTNTGVISGTPTAAGAAVAGIQAQDKPEDPGCIGCGCAAREGGKNCPYREFSINILAGLSIDNQSVQPGTVGQQYSQPLSATFVTTTNPRAGTPATGVTWSLTSGTLPPGITLSTAGMLAGMPTTEGSFQFVVKAQRDATQVDTETLTVTVRQPLAITASRPLGASALLTRWEVGLPFSAKLTGSGGTGTYTWALASGSLPAGFALAADGTLAGTTQAVGSSQATLRLSDSEGRTADYAANFLVAPRLAVSTLALKPGKVGRPYRARVSATGGVIPKSWTIVRGPLPRGIRFDRTLGVLSGTPTKAGRYRVTFQVTDGLKVVAVKRLRIDVLGVPK
jgi:hypothetical protein